MGQARSALERNPIKVRGDQHILIVLLGQLPAQQPVLEAGKQPHAHFPHGLRHEIAFDVEIALHCVAEGVQHAGIQQIPRRVLDIARVQERQLTKDVLIDDHLRIQVRPRQDRCGRYFRPGARGGGRRDDGDPRLVVQRGMPPRGTCSALPKHLIRVLIRMGEQDADRLGAVQRRTATHGHQKFRLVCPAVVRDLPDGFHRRIYLHGFIAPILDALLLQRGFNVFKRIVAVFPEAACDHIGAVSILLQNGCIFFHALGPNINRGMDDKAEIIHNIYLLSSAKSSINIKRTALKMETSESDAVHQKFVSPLVRPLPPPQGRPGFREIPAALKNGRRSPPCGNPEDAGAQKYAAFPGPRAGPKRRLSLLRLFAFISPGGGGVRCVSHCALPHRPGPHSVLSNGTAWRG